jgi:hypothetical protein
VSVGMSQCHACFCDGALCCLGMGHAVPALETCLNALCDCKYKDFFKVCAKRGFESGDLLGWGGGECGHVTVSCLLLVMVRCNGMGWDMLCLLRDMPHCPTRLQAHGLSPRLMRPVGGWHGVSG